MNVISTRLSGMEPGLDSARNNSIRADIAFTSLVPPEEGMSLLYQEV
jgi:hypothetical protein